jgi:hypothetical protein
VRLTEPQAGAIQCRDWSEEPHMRRQLRDGALVRMALVFQWIDRDALADELNDASNAEDEHAQELRREGELECARHAARAARVLANLRGRVLLAKI